MKTQSNINSSTLQNIIVPAMASQTATLEGFATQATYDHYQRLSDAKPHLLFVEYSHVSQQGKSEKNQLGAYDDTQIPGLKKIAQIIQSRGSLAGLQITHGGGKTTTEITGRPLMSPSGIPVPGVKGVLETPLEATEADISQIQADFLAAIDRANEAGFDWVELHIAHGYGLNQWVSPLTNKRGDKYGGSQANRVRFVSEILEQAKTKHPKMNFSARFPGEDFIEGGLTKELSLETANLLSQAGLDLLNVSSGLGGWRRPGSRDGEGYLLKEAQFLARNQKLPVAAVGGFATPAGISEALKSVQFTAVGRRVLENPKSFYQSFSN